MQAVLQNIETVPETPTITKPVFGAGIIDLPDNVQNALDHMIDYYKKNAMKPKIEVSGNPLDIVAALITQIRQNLPKTEDAHAKILLDYMVQDIVDYCRATGSSYLSLTYQFDKGGKR